MNFTTMAHLPYSSELYVLFDMLMSHDQISSLLAGNAIVYIHLVSIYLTSG